MVSDRPEKSRKLFVAGIVVGAVVVCLFVAVALLVISSYGHNTGWGVLDLAFAGNGTVSEDQVSATMTVLQNRFDALGYDASVSRALNDSRGAIISVNYGYVSTAGVTAIATTPGHFEMRIQTAGNLSEHILYRDEVKSATSFHSTGPVGDSVSWGLSLLLTPAGAEHFRQACIDQNATNDPENHSIITLLDGKVVQSTHLSSDMARQIASQPVDTIINNAGMNDQAYVLVETICASVSGGELPVPLKVAGM